MDASGDDGEIVALHAAASVARDTVVTKGRRSGIRTKRERMKRARRKHGLGCRRK
jgi:hypothetical protein